MSGFTHDGPAPSRRRFLGTVLASAAGLAAAAIPHAGMAAAANPYAGRARGAPRPRRLAELRFDTAPAAELYLLLEKAARGQTELPERWAEAIARIERAAERLPGRAGFSLVGGLAAESRTLEEFEAAAAAMPQTGPGGVPLRAVLAEIVEALRLAEPLYAEGLAAERAAAVADARRDWIDRLLLPREQACLDFVLSGLAIADPGAAVPVILVADAPEPGSFTSRSRRHGAICVVGVLPHPGSALLEVVLHEATHALETIAGDQPASVLARIREGLREAGVQPTDPLIRDVPHTVMFVHTGEAVRRLLDAEHVHYGDAFGYYASVARIAPAVRAAWTEHLDGRIGVDAAVARIVTESLSARAA